MANIAFIGLGNMGLAMASNLLAVGHAVSGYDVRPTPMSRLEAAGGRAVENAVFAVAEADFVISSLPDLDSVRDVWTSSPELLRSIKRSAVIIETSTIGIEEARQLAGSLEAAGLTMLDAPVLGDPRDARARLLTFPVGGSLAAFMEAKPILSDVGDRVIHVGKSGMGQAAALCNQLMTIINLAGAAEAFALAERLGLMAEKLFEVASLSSATSWVLAERCPQSGLVPSAPSNNLYHGGWAAEQALKYLRSIVNTGEKADARIPMANTAFDLFAEFVDTKDGKLDFSALIQILRKR